MKKYKKEVATNYVYCNSVCDICGEFIVKDTGLYDKIDVINITHRKEEYSYHSGSSSYKKDYDICPECFEKHIRPLFGEQTHE